MISGGRLLVSLGLVLLALGAWWIANEAVPAPTPAPADEPAADRGIDEAALKQDLRALIQGDGRLPPDYVPSGSRFAPRDPPDDPRAPTLAGARLEPVASPDGAPGLVLEVAAVAPGSRAAAAGLSVGDRILEIAGEAPSPSAVVDAQAILRNGGQLQLRVRRRNGETVTRTIERAGS
ncbi:MAG: PDZ domain-containing protein [Planctomycetota bacterium]|nr:PDZ domain-containing protein [Planctomycetota bacterium]